ncbi:Uncharacterized protein TCAP_02227 [Tolypocladium capitatum]|uniref:Uncharacterized protein n=1 Tax=Tolypocladium capitatum TaxID=45235 RepID=A0A2K3QJZ0_9HYPO|nr:Uncharacterized protein TCAP_02227 [Tolypocladium capitatum]
MPAARLRHLDEQACTAPQHELPAIVVEDAVLPLVAVLFVAATLLSLSPKPVHPRPAALRALDEHLARCTFTEGAFIEGAFIEGAFIEGASLSSGTAEMNVDDHVVPSGQHYSGRNRVPNIREFMERFDAGNKERDAAVGAHLGRNETITEARHPQNSEKPKRKDLGTVRDPITGKDVGLRDVQTDFKEAADNPQVSMDSPFGVDARR